MGRGWRLIAAAVLVALAAPSSARADERPRVDFTTWIEVVTTYEADAACPSQAELEARIRELVRTRARPIEAHVRIAPAEGGFEAHMEVLDGATIAMRTLHGRDCDALASTVALVIAMVIDPSAAERAAEEGEHEVEVEPEVEREAEPEPEPDVEPEPEPEPEVEREFQPEPGSHPTVAFVGDLFFVGGAGLLPGPSYGALGLAGLRIEGLELGLGAVLLAESRAALSSTRGGDFGLALGRFRVAYAVDLSPFEIVPALAFDVGATWGRGYGVVHPGSGTALSVDGAAGLEVRFFFLAELGITLFGELTVPLLRPDFVLTGIATTPVFRASDVGTFFGLGVVVRSR